MGETHWYFSNWSDMEISKYFKSTNVVKLFCVCNIKLLCRLKSDFNLSLREASIYIVHFQDVNPSFHSNTDAAIK